MIECTDRDAPFVLDGVLYHESDLDLEEHYTDTHGYTEINFAAFVCAPNPTPPRCAGRTPPGSPGCARRAPDRCFRAVLAWNPRGTLISHEQRARRRPGAADT